MKRLCRLGATGRDSARSEYWYGSSSSEEEEGDVESGEAKGRNSSEIVAADAQRSIAAGSYEREAKTTSGARYGLLKDTLFRQ